MLQKLELLNEFNFDLNSSERIVNIIYRYPICLRDIADILEELIPLLEKMPGHSVTNEIHKFVKSKIKNDELKYNSAYYRIEGQND